MKKLIIIAGMQRSGSTWLYNTVRHVLESSGLLDIGAGWINDFSSFKNHDVVIIKIHSFEPLIAENATSIFYSFRDIRDVLASFKRKWNTEPSIEAARAIIQNDIQWRKKASFIMKYEDMIVAQEKTVKEISEFLEIQNVDPQQIIRDINDMMYEKGKNRNTVYNTENLLHKNHITDGRHGSWEGIVPQELITQIENDFHVWMLSNGYLSRNDQLSIIKRLNSASDLVKNAQKLYSAENFDDAETCLSEILHLDPSNGTANYLSGLIAFSQGKDARALKHFKIAASHCTDDPAIYYNYGSLLQRNAKYQKALVQYEKALALKPDYIPALNNYSALLNTMGMATKAEQAARKIIDLKPDLFDPHINLANSLKDQGRIKEAIESYSSAMQIQPDHEIGRSNMLLCLNYSDFDMETVFKEHTQWDLNMRPKIPVLHHSEKVIEPDRRPLRVGYVSAYFKTHSILYFIEHILENHDRSQFEIFCYADISTPDPTTIRIKNLPLTWRAIHNKSNEQAAELIVKDNIDILIDCDGHAGNRRLSLFLNRLASVQITYLGYPNTTGISTMDYRLTDEIADPANQNKYYTEKLYRLPGCFLCYNPPKTSPPVNEPPVIKNGYITFGSFNNLPKISPETLTTWAQLLKTVPRSKLYIKTRFFIDEEVAKNFEEFFTRQNIEKERLIFKGHAPSLDEHLNCYNRVDIALDTFPYNGTTTTCEALWMGVPVVCLAGSKHSGRVGATLLKSVGLSSMIAENSEKYVSLASYLAHDVPQLSKLKKGLRPAVAQSPLCDGKTFTRKLEDAYRDMWQRNAKENRK